MRETSIDGGRRGIPWRVIGWGGAGLLLLVPLVAGAPWTLPDFIVAGAMFGIAGLVIELTVRASDDLFYRGGTLAAVLASFLLVWVNGAVGFLGDEDNPANLMFLGVIAIAILGSALSGFKAAGMARTMFAAAGAQVLAAVIGLAAGWASPDYSGIYEVVLGTGIFLPLWLASAGLFRRAAG